MDLSNHNRKKQVSEHRRREKVQYAERLDALLYFKERERPVILVDMPGRHYYSQPATATLMLFLQLSEMSMEADYFCQKGSQFYYMLNDDYQHMDKDIINDINDYKSYLNFLQEFNQKTTPFSTCPKVVNLSEYHLLKNPSPLAKKVAIKIGDFYYLHNRDMNNLLPFNKVVSKTISLSNVVNSSTASQSQKSEFSDIKQEAQNLFDDSKIDLPSNEDLWLETSRMNKKAAKYKWINNENRKIRQLRHKNNYVYPCSPQVSQNGSDVDDQIEGCEEESVSAPSSYPTLKNCFQISTFTTHAIASNILKSNTLQYPNQIEIFQNFSEGKAKQKVINHNAYVDHGNPIDAYSLYLQGQHNAKMHALNGNSCYVDANVQPTVTKNNSILPLVEDDIIMLDDNFHEYHDIVDIFTQYLSNENIEFNHLIVLHKSFTITTKGFYVNQLFYEQDWFQPYSVLYTSVQWLVLSQTKLSSNQSLVYFYHQHMTKTLITQTVRIFDYILLKYIRFSLFCHKKSMGSTILTTHEFNKFILITLATDRSQPSIQTFLSAMGRRTQQFPEMIMPENTVDVLYVYLAHINYLIANKLKYNADFMHYNMHVTKKLFPDLMAFQFPIYSLVLLLLLFCAIVGYSVYNVETVSHININTNSTFFDFNPFNTTQIGNLHKTKNLYPTLMIILSTFFVLVFVHIIISFVKFTDVNIVDPTTHVIAKITGLCMAPHSYTMKPLFKHSIRTLACHKHRTFAYVYGPAFHKKLSLCESCPESLVRAFEGRQAKHFNIKIMEDRMLCFFRNYHRYLKRSPIVWIDPQIWALRFGGGKTKMYLKALDDIKKGAPIDQQFEAFVKKELLLKAENPYIWTEYDPRFISASKPTYTVRTGPQTYSIAKHMLKSFVLEDGIIFAFGYNKTELGELFSTIFKIIPNHVVMTADNSRHDAHVHAFLLMAEFEMTTLLVDYTDDEYLKLFLDIFRRNGYSRFQAAAYFMAMCYTRYTGLNNTSHGNSFISLGCHDFALCHLFDVFLARLKKMMITVITGDDIYHVFDIRLNLPGEKQYDELVALTGMECSSTYVEDHEMSFCSNLFIPVEGDTFVATQYPGKNFCKAYATIHEYNENQAMYFVKAQAKAYVQDFSHLPIMYDFHNQVLKVVNHVKHAKIHSETLVEMVKHTSKAHKANVKTTNWFKHRYNFDYNKNIFEHCRTLREINEVVQTNQWIQMIIDTDTNEPSKAAYRVAQMVGVPSSDYRAPWDPKMQDYPCNQFIPFTGCDGLPYVWDPILKKQYDNERVKAHYYYVNYSTTQSELEVKDGFLEDPAINMINNELAYPDHTLPNEQFNHKYPYNPNSQDVYNGLDDFKLNDKSDKPFPNYQYDPKIDYNSLKLGRLIYTKQVIDQGFLMRLQNHNLKTNSRIGVLFGDNNVDYERLNGPRIHFGGMASICGPFDRDVCFGVITTHYPALTDDQNRDGAFQLGVNQSLQHAVNMTIKAGFDLVVPEPSEEDLKKPKYFDPGQPPRQVIFHNLGTGIANCSNFDLYYIQKQLDDIGFNSSRIVHTHDYYPQVDYLNELKIFDDNKNETVKIDIDSLKRTSLSKSKRKSLNSNKDFEEIKILDQQINEQYAQWDALKSPTTSIISLSNPQSDEKLDISDVRVPDLKDRVKNWLSKRISLNPIQSNIGKSLHWREFYQNKGAITESLLKPINDDNDDNVVNGSDLIFKQDYFQFDTDDPDK